MNIYNARMMMFVIWLLLFGAYVFGFLVVGLRNDIDDTEAREAAWTVGYILVPVLIAFAQFYLGPEADQNMKKDPNRIVHGQQVFVMLALTVCCHAPVLFFFIAYVWTAEFDFSSDHTKSFTGISSFGFKLLLFLGTLPIFAVNYVLGRKDVAMGQPTAN